MFKVENTRLFDRLRAYLNLKNVDYAPVTLSTGIIPVIDISQRTTVGGNGSATTYDISSTAASIFTCPTGYRGTIRFLYRAGTTGANAYFYLVNAAGASVARLGQSGTSSFAYTGMMVPLLEGYQIMCSTSSNPADTAILISCVVEMEPLILVQPNVGAATLGDYG